MPILKSAPATKIELPMEAIRALCDKYDVAELSVFGSVLRDDFRPGSDVDFIVVFKNNDYGPWMGKLMDLEEELSRLLQRKVDLVSKGGVEQSRNWMKRKHILQSAQVIYGS